MVDAHVLPGGPLATRSTRNGSCTGASRGARATRPVVQDQLVVHPALAAEPAEEGAVERGADVVPGLVRGEGDRPAGGGDPGHQRVGVDVSDTGRHRVLLLEQQAVAGTGLGPVQLDAHVEQQVVVGRQRIETGDVQVRAGGNAHAARARRASRPDPP